MRTPHAYPALLIALAIAASNCVSADKRADADIIITNAAVYSLRWPDPKGDGTSQQGSGASTVSPDAKTIAIRDGIITAVGAAAMQQRGSATRVIDAKGMALLPGLVDAHVHLANIGASLVRVNLVGVTTEEEAVRRVEERAATTPAGEWIVGYGWDEGAWASRYPTMRLLSERVPNHPVWLAGLHSFAGWGNKLAFERAAITPQTQAPSGGEIRKDASGQPTGVLLNNAVRLVESAIPQPSAAEMDARMSAALQAMANSGYTAVHDGNTDSAMLASLERLNEAGKLPIRVSVMLASSDSALVRRWIARGPDIARAKMLRVYTVKAFYDGALGSRGALLAADYSDTRGHRGRGGKDIGFNESLLTDAMRAGFQIAIHAIGDAGNTRTLDFLEQATAQTPGSKELRHRVEHAQVLALPDIPRFAKLDVIASMQPGHAIEDKAWAEQRVGKERIRGGYAWRSLKQNGARLLFSSDMPGSNYDFFYMLHAAVTRTDPELKPEGGWYQAEKMTAEEAIRGYTAWAAYASFTEKESGVIEVGRWADLTLLDRDPFSPENQEAGKLLGGKAMLTIVGGKVVAEGGGARSSTGH